MPEGKEKTKIVWHAGLRILSKKAGEDDIEYFIKEAKFETLLKMSH